MEIEVQHIAFAIEKEAQDNAPGVYKLVVRALVPMDEITERKELQRVEKLIETTNVDDKGKPIFEKKIVNDEITVREVVKINKPTEFGNFIVYGDFSEKEYKTMARAYVANNNKLDKLTHKIYGA
jgi:hypothetical protein